MIDVHHTILPLTAKPQPLPELMIASREDMGNGVAVLRPEDMVCHAAAHLVADGDLSGGMRNLWDIHCLCEEFAAQDDEFFPALYERGWEHDLLAPLLRALRLSVQVYGTDVAAYEAPVKIDHARHWSDNFFERRILARDGWGRQTGWPLRQFFYIRSHLLRMPLPMLTRHLWTKWRKGHNPD